MTSLHALIFSIVEGISEFLPISSTGHLMLTGHLLGLPQTEFLKSFEIAIQLGAILSVLVLYWRSFLLRPDELARVMCAFIPTAIVGFVLYKFIKKYLLADIHVVLWSLFIGGIVLIVFEKTIGARSRGVSPTHPTGSARSMGSTPATQDAPNRGEGIRRISYAQAFWIGLIQAVAVIPGVSRSAATIVGGLLLGVERKTIVEFSFLLAVPTMAAATALDLLKNADTFSRDQFGVLAIGFAGSFVVALLCIRWFLGFIQKHSFTAFGVYRIALALTFWAFLAVSS